MNDLQDKIKKIHNNPNLTNSEKMKQIQALYLKQYTVPESKQMKQTPCTHYNRKNKIYCKECSTFYNCRLCHDEINDHKIDRFTIDLIKCTECSKEQSPSQICIKCNTIFGEYYCDICHLWELNNIDIYHCDKCKICRKGKREDFTHCNTCDMCMLNTFHDTHKCVSETMKNNCPICRQYMFDSVEGINILPCGHSIHAECMKSLLQKDYRCPLCKKSVAKMNWRAFDRVSNSILIPRDYRDKTINILCNDCEQRSTIPFTIELYKCKSCGGYNTTVTNEPESTIDIPDVDSTLAASNEDLIIEDYDIDSHSGDSDTFV
jgi:RING finger/CHY zinc finger protein 1